MADILYTNVELNHEIVSKFSPWDSPSKYPQIVGGTQLRGGFDGHYSVLITNHMKEFSMLEFINILQTLFGKEDGIRLFISIRRCMMEYIVQLFNPRTIQSDKLLFDLDNPARLEIWASSKTKTFYDIIKNYNIPFHFYLLSDYYYHPVNKVTIIPHNLSIPNDFQLDNFEYDESAECSNFIDDDYSTVGEVLSRKNKPFIFKIENSYIFMREESLVEMATFQNDNWIYQCPERGTNQDWDFENIYVLLRITSNFSFHYSYVNAMLLCKDKRIFEIYSKTPKQIIDRAASWKNTPIGEAHGLSDGVGALHCSDSREIFKLRTHNSHQFMSTEILM